MEVPVIETIIVETAAKFIRILRQTHNYVRFVYMDEAKKHVAVLEIIDGPPGVKGRRVDFKDIPLLIGRSPQVDLMIPDPKVSKNHAVLEKRGNQYFLVDLESKNGTSLNGERIFQPEGAKLRHGDDIMIADTRLKFYLFEGLGDAELQAIQKRITYNVILKYSNSSAVIFCEIPEFREMYVKYEVAEVDSMRDKFIKIYRELVHEGGPYYAEPRGEKALACFETVVGAFDFSKTFLRRIEKFNLGLLRDPNAAIKKLDLKIALDVGPLSLILGDEGRIEKVTGAPITKARSICELAKNGEFYISEAAINNIPNTQHVSIEEVKETGSLGKIFKYLSDTTAYI